MLETRLVILRRHCYKIMSYVFMDQSRYLLEVIQTCVLYKYALMVIVLSLIAELFPFHRFYLILNLSQFFELPFLPSLTWH
jgi:hypothetical protein